MTRERARRVMVVFGTRPEAIKMLPVIREFRRRPTIAASVVVTGQHRDMVDNVFDLFEERADENLAVMTHDQTLDALSACLLTSVGKLLAEQKPDLVLVHGDTTTALCAAMAAFYAKIPIGHVEAGLRSFDLSAPWPEEFNRVTIDSVANLLFAPTEKSAANLQLEYRHERKIIVTGNTGIDSVLYIANRLDTDARFREDIGSRFENLFDGKHLVLVTAHRRESFGDGIERICDALQSIAARGDVHIVFPVHPNPNVASVARRRLDGIANISLVPPVSYGEMVYLMKRAKVILTDSGGLQEEGPALGKPVLVMRDLTERPEALTTGLVELVGTDVEKVCSTLARWLDDNVRYAELARPSFPFGDGTAAIKITDAIEETP